MSKSKKKSSKPEEFKLPKKIKLGAITYNVSENTLMDPWGRVNHSVAEIQVGGLLTDQLKRATLVHEIFHALFFINGDRDLADNEAIVERTANAVTAWMSDNDMSWLTGEK